MHHRHEPSGMSKDAFWTLCEQSFRDEMHAKAQLVREMLGDQNNADTEQSITIVEEAQTAMFLEALRRVREKLDRQFEFLQETSQLVQAIDDCLPMAYRNVVAGLVYGTLNLGKATDEYLKITEGPEGLEGLEQAVHRMFQELGEGSSVQGALSAAEGHHYEALGPIIDDLLFRAGAGITEGNFHLVTEAATYACVAGDVTRLRTCFNRLSDGNKNYLTPDSLQFDEEAFLESLVMFIERRIIRDITIDRSMDEKEAFDIMTYTCASAAIFLLRSLQSLDRIESDEQILELAKDATRAAAEYVQRQRLTEAKLQVDFQA